MATINISKKVKVLQQGLAGNPSDKTLPIHKLWAAKEGEKFDTVKGLVKLPYLDSAVLGPDGKPYVFYDFMPERWLYLINDLGPNQREAWPPPSDELADDEELIVAGPGMWNVAKRGGESLLKEAIQLLYKALEKLESL